MIVPDERQTAIDLRNRREYEAAAAACDRVLATNPGDAEMLYCRGYCRYMLADYAASLDDLARVPESAPEHLDALKYRGSARLCLGRFAEALPDLDCALQRDPADPEVWRDRGQARRETNDYQGSIDDYTRALELRPDYRRAHWGRGLAYQRRENHAEAVADFTRCLELEPTAADTADVLANRSWCLRKQGRYAEACYDLDRVLEIDPQRAGDFWARGLCRQSLNDEPRALADYRQAVALQPEFAEQLGPTIRDLENRLLPRATPDPAATAAPAGSAAPPPPTIGSRATDLTGVIGGVFGAIFTGIGILLIVGVALTFAALALFSVVKATDVIYSTWHVAAHWNDEQAFPPHTEFCKGLYCRRIDTTQKHVAGSFGRQSELFGSYCPDHERFGYLFFLNLSIFGTMCWLGYCVCVLVSTALWYAAAIGLAASIVVLPVLPLVTRETRRRIFERVKTACLAVGVVLSFLSGLVYVWW